jgi:hypothetical protein
MFFSEKEEKGLLGCGLHAAAFPRKLLGVTRVTSSK